MRLMADVATSAYEPFGVPGQIAHQRIGLGQGDAHGDSGGSILESIKIVLQEEGPEWFWDLIRRTRGANA